MAWQKLITWQKRVICLGKIVISTPHGTCVPAIPCFAHGGSSWVPLTHHKSAFSRKFLIFVWLGCCYSVFFTHTRPCLLQASYLLLHSWIAATLSSLGYILRSTQELYAAALLLSKVFHQEQKFYKIICWFWCEQLAKDLLRPLSAVKEEDRAQIAVQDNRRTLSVRSSQFWHLLEAVWGLWGGGC